MSFYSHYRGRCTGRIIYFMHQYCDYHTATHCQIGNGKVVLWDKPVATFTWETGFGRGDVPIFEFVGERRDDYERAQVEKRERAIADACLLNYVEPSERKPVECDVMMALLADGTRSARIYGQVVHGAEPEFFVHDKHAYFDAAGWVYRWDHEIGGWLLWVQGERRAA